MRRAASAALAALLGLGVLAGCSGGGGGSDTSAFATQGNALCKKLATDDAKARSELGTSPSPEVFTNYIKATFGPEAIQTYQQIAALPLPKDKAEMITTVLIDVIAEIKLIEADPTTGGDKVNQTELVAKLESYGLTECGAGFTRRIDHTTFLARADALCREINVTLGGLAKDQGITAAATSEKKAAFAVSDGLPRYRELVASIEQIGFPPEDADALKQLVALWRADLDRQTADPLLFYQAGRPEAAAVNQAWTAFGTPDCGVNANIGVG